MTIVSIEINAVWFPTLRLSSCPTNIFNPITLCRYHTCRSACLALFVWECMLYNFLLYPFIFHVHRFFVCSSSMFTSRSLIWSGDDNSTNRLKQRLYHNDRFLLWTVNKLFLDDGICLENKLIDWTISNQTQQNYGTDFTSLFNTWMWHVFNKHSSLLDCELSQWINESLSAEWEKLDWIVCIRGKEKTRSPRTTKNDDWLPEQNILRLQEERGWETLRAWERMLSVITFLRNETRIRAKRKRDERDRWHHPLASRQQKTSAHGQKWTTALVYDISDESSADAKMTGRKSETW